MVSRANPSASPSASPRETGIIKSVSRKEFRVTHRFLVKGRKKTASTKRIMNGRVKLFSLVFMARKVESKAPVYHRYRILASGDANRHFT